MKKATVIVPFLLTSLIAGCGPTLHIQKAATSAAKSVSHHQATPVVTVKQQTQSTTPASATVGKVHAIATPPLSFHLNLSLPEPKGAVPFSFAKNQQAKSSHLVLPTTISFPTGYQPKLLQRVPMPFGTLALGISAPVPNGNISSFLFIGYAKNLPNQPVWVGFQGRRLQLVQVQNHYFAIRLNITQQLGKHFTDTKTKHGHLLINPAHLLLEGTQPSHYRLSIPLNMAGVHGAPPSPAVERILAYYQAISGTSGRNRKQAWYMWAKDQLGSQNAYTAFLHGYASTKSVAATILTHHGLHATVLLKAIESSGKQLDYIGTYWVKLTPTFNGPRYLFTKAQVQLIHGSPKPLISFPLNYVPTYLPNGSWRYQYAANKLSLYATSPKTETKAVYTIGESKTPLADQHLQVKRFTYNLSTQVVATVSWLGGVQGQDVILRFFEHGLYFRIHSRTGLQTALAFARSLMARS